MDREISSYSDGLLFALTNPIFTSPTGFEWSRQWTEDQLYWRNYMKNGIVFENKLYRDVEEAYQKNKFNYGKDEDLFGKSKFDLMTNLIQIKLSTYPQLVSSIFNNGGLSWISQCTHQPTKKNTYWETNGKNGFIRALWNAYSKIEL